MVSRKDRLRQGGFTFPWLFIMSMDGLARESNAREMEKGAALSKNDAEHTLELKQILFVDDVASAVGSGKLNR